MQMNRLDKTEQVLCCVIGHDTLWGAVAEWRAVLGSDPRQRGTVCVQGSLLLFIGPRIHSGLMDLLWVFSDR